MLVAAAGGGVDSSLALAGYCAALGPGAGGVAEEDHNEVGA